MAEALKTWLPRAIIPRDLWLSLHIKVRGDTDVATRLETTRDGIISLQTLLIALLMLTSISLYGQCKAGDVLVGEDSDNYYCLQKSRYENSIAQGMAKKYCEQRLQVSADQRAIRELGFASDVERLDGYRKLADDQKQRLQHKVINAMLDQQLQAAEVSFSAAKGLNPWNVNRVIHSLEAKGFDNPVLIGALRRIAAQKGKPAMFAAYKDFVKKTKDVREQWETAKEIENGTANTELLLLLGALKCLQDDPALGLVVTATDFAESLGYIYFLSDDIDSLTRLTEDKLQRSSAISKRLMQQVDAMNTSRQAWRQETGYPKAAPACDSQY